MKNRIFGVFFSYSTDQSTVAKTRAASALIAPPRGQRVTNSATFRDMINMVWGSHLDQIYMI